MLIKIELIFSKFPPTDDLPTTLRDLYLPTTLKEPPDIFYKKKKNRRTIKKKYRVLVNFKNVLYGRLSIFSGP